MLRTNSLMTCILYNGVFIVFVMNPVDECKHTKTHMHTHTHTSTHPQHTTHNNPYIYRERERGRDNRACDIGGHNLIRVFFITKRVLVMHKFI